MAVTGPAAFPSAMASSAGSASVWPPASTSTQTAKPKVGTRRKATIAHTAGLHPGFHQAGFGFAGRALVTRSVSPWRGLGAGFAAVRQERRLEARMPHQQPGDRAE